MLCNSNLCCGCKHHNNTALLILALIYTPLLPCVCKHQSRNEREISLICLLPYLSWDLKIKKKLKTVPLCLGKLRPVVGQRCHQCTPDSLVSKFEKNYSLGFHNLLSVNETDTRYRGWLARRMCCALFVSGCKVYVSPMPKGIFIVSSCFCFVFQGSLLVYVYVRQSIMDCALIPLVLFCQNLRVPYTLCPLQINSSFLRYTVIILTHKPLSLSSLSVFPAQLVRELLHEGQAISVGVSAKSGQGGQWLAHIRQLIKEGSVPDVSLVPVGISYDSLPTTNIQVDACKHTLAHLLRATCNCNVLRFVLEQGFQTRRCILPCWGGVRRMSWLLPPHYASELEPSDPERDLSTVIILHHIFSATSCTAVMSTSLVSSLLLYRHRKGVSLSALCRDVVWLTEEVLLKNKDVGFGGSLAEVVHHSLSLLTPHLIIAAVPSRKDPFIIPRPSLAASLHLNLQAHIVRHTFILEAVGACAVSAISDMEFDVVLCQSELTERALQLCHLLPPGFMPPCQSSHSFALDAIDSLVRCGILVMEEVRNIFLGVPVCDFWKKEGALSWTTSDDPYHSDSDCGEEELHSYRVMKTQPRQCPEMLFFFCSMLAGHLRTLCWTVKGLDLINTPLPGMFKG
uniref:GPAT/DHAPAT C-terminal domain-containing protein n=1 Tax=Monopterus albus TaxID=43700 RepID=A0A3Q3KF13_MONAL